MSTSFPPQRTPTPGPAAPVRVLCVEDAEFVHQLYRVAFRRRGGVQSFEAHDGLEALSLLERHGPVDLIIVDVNMPVMDGLEFVRHLRRRPGHEATYVLLATTEDQQGRVKKTLEEGPGRFLRKPFTLERFIDELERALAETRPGRTTP